MAVPLGKDLGSPSTIGQLAGHRQPVGFRWSHWLSCASVANLCLARIWTDLLAYPVWPAHRDYDPPQLAHYAAAVILTLVLGSLLWLTLNRIRNPRAQGALGIALLLLICKEVFLAVSGLGGVPRGSLLTPVPLAIAVVTFGLIGSQLYFHQASLRKIASRLATSLIPLLLLTFGQSAWQATRIPPPSVRGIQAPRTAGQPRRRVVWLILDELDERVAFSQRRAGLRLPELDRFRREAGLVAFEARAPENSTFVSLPRLLNFSAVSGEAGSSMLARAKRAGHRTAIVGWAIPYCSIFAQWADSCAWWPMPQQANSYGSGLAAVLRGFAISLLETNQLSLLGQSQAVQHFAHTVEEMTEEAAAAASRPDLDFVFLHLPPPHSPYAFNPQTGKIDRPIFRFPNPAGYLDNLLLADQVFGRIRRAMEQQGVWDKSLVLVTADHGFRASSKLGYGPDDRHVPFMVKSPSPLPVHAQAPLDTKRTGDLLLNWLADHKS